MAVEPRCNPERGMIYEAWSEALLADGAPPGTRPAWSAGEPPARNRYGEGLPGRATRSATLD
jgi:hypothetical protein